MKKDNELLWSKSLPDNVSPSSNARALSKAEADKLLNDTPKRAGKNHTTPAKSKKK